MLILVSSLGSTKMKNESAIEQFMSSDEFFSFGAMIADTENDELVLASGGDISSKRLEVPTYFFAKDFYSDSFTYYYPKSILRVGLKEALSYFERFKSTPSIIESTNFDHIYESDFNNFKSKLGELQKVVLISREEFKVNNFKDTLKHFFYSALNFGTGYPYGYWNQTQGILGASPELLYRIRGNELSTFALAGTAKKEEGEKLLQSHKDRHEHNIVIDDIREKLTPYCQDIVVGETHLHPFKHIVHLRTDFKAHLNPDADFVKLTQEMSPTAALGGYPMKASMRFLADTAYARRFPNRIFGSVMGLVTPESTTAVVMIRNLQWNNEKFIIECGGGVVSESILENELSEIELKRNIIKKNYL